MQATNTNDRNNKEIIFFMRNLFIEQTYIKTTILTLLPERNSFFYYFCLKQLYIHKMKNYFFTWMMAFICSTSLLAQNTISVSYEFPKDLFIHNLMRFQNIDAYDVTVKGPFKNTPYKLYMIRNKEGKTERKELNAMFPCRMDSVKHFFLFAQPETPDTVHIKCFYDTDIDLHIPIDTKYCILMQTLPTKPYTVTDPIPLMAYTAGEEKTLTFNGETVKAIDYCGVRYSNTHPSE